MPHFIPYHPATASDILTFNPVRLHLPGFTVDALLDALNPWGGCFFVMTDGVLPTGLTAEERDRFFGRLGRIELEWGWGSETWKLPCRVRGYSLDQEGLAPYLTLRFLDSDPASREALEAFMASLW